MVNILVVDDSMFSRRNLKAILTQAGYNVIAEASNGLEALSKFKEYKPDLITMDITMPIQNGIDAVKSIISISPDAKIVMISAIDQKSSVFDALQYGAKHYIIKPFNYEKIVTVLEKVLSQESSGTREETAFIHEDKKVTPNVQKEINAPIALEIKNSMVIVNIIGELNTNNFHYFKDAIGTLLLLRPLKLIVNFMDTEYLEELILFKILELLDKVQNADGKAVLFSRNFDFLKRITEKNIPILISHYNDNLDYSKIEI